MIVVGHGGVVEYGRGVGIAGIFKEDIFGAFRFVFRSYELVSTDALYEIKHDCCPDLESVVHNSCRMINSSIDRFWKCKHFN